MLLLSIAYFLLATAQAASLADVCTPDHVKASLPSNGFVLGITIDPSSVTANPVTNVAVKGQNFYPDAVFDYCNVTFAYSHNGRNDRVVLWHWLPAPSNFQNRYLLTGGGGYASNGGNMSLPGGIIYGAVAGLTDGGFGGFGNSLSAVDLLANGTLNYPEIFMFGYQGLQECATIGKQFTKQFFNTSNKKLFSYYQGCSEGGREGWSQVQRFGEELDGAITGAPAFRFAHQQVQHLYSNVVEKTMGYFPPPCELDKINNETIAACDPMDGKTDGVVSRTDLCKLHFNTSTLIGKAYSCPATQGNPMMGSGPSPAQNGTVTAQGVAVAKNIVDGLHDLQGRRVYFSYQPAASFADAGTTYNSADKSWELSINGLGGIFPERYLFLLNETNLDTLDNVNYDTLKEWILQTWQKYEGILQTTWPDLTPFNVAGGKVLHFHGESDNSIPTASSVRYWESVRQIMYPGMSYNDSAAALNEWYRLFLVPGAAHCGPNTLQPNGPFPQTNLAVLIDWVENNKTPTTLNATYLAGASLGQNAEVCAWPQRPKWTNNGTTMSCVYDQASLDTWHYDLNAFKMPVY